MEVDMMFHGDVVRCDGWQRRIFVGPRFEKYPENNLRRVGPPQNDYAKMYDWKIQFRFTAEMTDRTIRVFFSWAYGSAQNGTVNVKAQLKQPQTILLLIYITRLPYQYAPIQ
jgi:hypothetical protein